MEKRRKNIIFSKHSDKLTSKINQLHFITTNTVVFVIILCLASPDIILSFSRVQRNKIAIKEKTDEKVASHGHGLPLPFIPFILQPLPLNLRPSSSSLLPPRLCTLTTKKKNK